jgi:NAD(P)-dependent dehydrogenase (short-subunit alcohol dehydrogenase family)
MWTKEDIPDQTGKTVVVTGANAGIGFETAHALYEAGAHVILACRSLEKAEDARVRLQARQGRGLLETGILDLSDLHSVAQFADTFLEKHNQLHVLINNAGVMSAGLMAPRASKTTEGYELQFGVNFLGHFALTGRLYPLLKATPGARIVTLSSMAYLRGVIAFDNLKSEKSYEPMREYSQSKLADLLFSIELHRRITSGSDQVLSIAVQPGANKTELIRYMSDEEIAAGIERVGPLMDPWQGALPSLYAAVSKDAAGGNLYEPDSDGYRGYPTLATIKENALDETVARKLWDLAEQITGIYYPEL